MTSYDDTKVQLTINRMTEECYENVPNKSSTELYLISQDPTSIAKIDLDAQSRTDAEISSIQSDLNALQSDLNDLSSEVSTLSEWTTTQIDDLIGDVQEVSSQAAQNAQDIADISANLTHSTVRRWEYVEYNGLTFTAEEANSTVAMQKVGSAPDVSLEYSTGDGWNDFIVGETTVTLPSIGDQVVIRAKTTNSRIGESGYPNAAYNKFVMTGKIAASDSIMYLLKNDGDLDVISAGYCFFYLFADCSSLTQAPELPATTLATHCYQGIFDDCSSLTAPPELPATTLATFCYAAMFNRCSSLTTAPELPATALTQTCYGSMFSGCTSLTQAPELLATDLADGCYDQMFKGCTSLTTAPELPATTLASKCYSQMFSGCSSLNSIKIAYTGNFDYSYFSYWMSGVASTGTFYYDGEDTTTGTSAIPTGWEVIGSSWPGLTFTAEQANSTVAMAANGSAPSVSLEYSTDDGRSWNTFTVGSTTVTLANIGDEVCFRAGSGGNTATATSVRNFNRFALTGSLAVKGNIMSLLDQTMTTTTLTQNATFASLFWNGRSGMSDPTPLVDASELELPATTLTQQCYANLFRNTRITTAPNLPATTMAESCYDGMFRDNPNLTTAPDVLPATSTVGQYTYASMFNGCSSLTKAPAIKATTLTSRCFDYMFSGCSSLNEIEIAYTGNFSNGLSSFNNWVNGVSASGTFYYDGNDTTTGNSAIPTNWTVQSF